MKGSVYMKKIVVFLLCLIAFNQISISAKTPDDIYIGGSGEFNPYFDTLDLPLHNTHFPKEGLENIAYLDEENRTQNVSILSKQIEELDTGTIYLTDKPFKENTVIQDRYFVDSVSYYIVGDIIDSSGLILSSFI